MRDHGHDQMVIGFSSGTVCLSWSVMGARLVFSTSRKARGLGSSFCDIWSSENFISNRAMDRVPLEVEKASECGSDGYCNMNLSKYQEEGMV